MNLDEKIKYEEEMAEIWKNTGKCSCEFQKEQKEHQQLADWLKDYKRLLKQEDMNNDKSF